MLPGFVSVALSMHEPTAVFIRHPVTLLGTPQAFNLIIVEPGQNGHLCLWAIKIERWLL